MDNRTKASNLVRAFNLAGAIVAADVAFTNGASAFDIRQAVEQLANELYEAQNNVFEAEGLGEDTRPNPPSKKSSGGWNKSSGGSSSSEGATFKQKAFVRRLIEDAGGDYTDVDVDALSKSEASELIQELQG